MKRRQALGTALAAFTLSGACFAQNTVLINSTTGVAWGTPAIDSASTWRNVPGTGVELNLAPTTGRFSLFLGGQSWNGSTHILADITNRSSDTALVWMGVFPASGSGCDARVSIGAGKRVRVLMPLRPPTEHRLLTWPPVPGYEAAVLQTYNTLNTNSINMFRFVNQNVTARSITVHRIERLTLTQDMNRLVDSFGQLREVNFPGKLAVPAGGSPGGPLIPDRDQNIGQALPYAADAFGAFANGAMRDTAGSWTIGKVNGRWSIFAPNGRQFFSFGINEVGIGSLSPVQGRDYMFTSLPPNSGETAEHYAVDRTRDGANLLSFNHYSHNLELKYGTNWRDAFTRRTLDRMRTWGFNTVGANTTRELMLQQTLPSVLYVAIEGNHARFNPPGNSKLMHDPFDPTFPASVRNSLEARINERGRHPYHMGIFIDNELPWGYQQDPSLRFALPIGVLRAPVTLPARQRFINNLQTKYAWISRLNAAWGTTFASWDALRNNPWNSPRPPSPGMQVDYAAFMSVFATQYFSTVDKVLGDLQYRGLYLGTRFENTVTPTEVLNAAARWADVLSFTVYTHDLNDGLAGYRNLDVPILICEFGFSSSDLGRVVNSNYPTLTSEDQIAGVQNFLRTAREWPNVVGVHYYRWSDCSASGRTWDGGNGSTGLVSITDIPYQGLVDALRNAITEYARVLAPTP